MRKHDLVRFDTTNPYIVRHIKTLSPIQGFTHTTAEDTQAWHDEMSRQVAVAKAKGEDTFSIVCDSAGESRLSPRSKTLVFPVDGVFTVIRARVRTTRGYHTVTGQTEILCTTTGQQGFVQRSFLEKV
jgi:hypothetical protein